MTIPDDVIGFGGDVPQGIMHKIVSAVRADLIAKLGKEFEAVRAMLEQLLHPSE